jgi:cytochrome c biogenesis protein CcmG, thiol:disulfide interchange protein DsbE
VKSGAPALKQAGWAAGALAAAGILAVLGWGLLHPAVGVSASIVGRRAPDLTIQTFQGPNARLQSYQGRPVVLNFWASWCAPCRQEEASLAVAAQHWQGKVQFLGVDFRDTASAGLADQQRVHYPYPVGPTLGQVPPDFGVMAPPTTFFIDSQGVVAARFLGPLDSAGINRYLSLVGMT